MNPYTKHFDEFFLEPEWPFCSDQNNPRFANLDNEYDQDAVYLKVHEYMDSEIVKIQDVHEEKPIVQEQVDFVFQEEDCDEEEKGEKDEEEEGEIQGETQLKDTPEIKIQHEEEEDYEDEQQSSYRKERHQRTCKSKVKIEEWSYSFCQANLSSSKFRDNERGKYKILSQETKKLIVQESKTMTMVQVAKKYGVSVNNICRWRKRCDRRSGAGRKVTDMQMQNRLLDWLLKQNNPVSRKQVQTMARKMSSQQNFKASKGWFERFYKRNKLSYNPGVQILTHNDYKLRVSKCEESRSSIKR